jgi:hypothetical protein
MTANHRGSLFMVCAMAGFAVEDMFIKSAAKAMPIRCPMEHRLTLREPTRPFFKTNTDATAAFKVLWSFGLFISKPLM